VGQTTIIEPLGCGLAHLGEDRDLDPMRDPQLRQQA
jgi:hypothetical protein